MKRILLSLNNFLLVSLSMLLGLLLFSIMKNQHHNDYIIDLNKRAPVIASQFKNLTPSNARDYYYSIYSLKEEKILESNLVESNEPRIRFNYTVPSEKDFVIVSIYEKELNYISLIRLTIYISIFSYIAGFIILYIIERKFYLLKEVEKLHFIDSLTQIYNKAKFIQTLEKRIKEKSNFYVVVTDIEDFKRINQLSGYEVGDLLLKNYALSLKLKKMIQSPARISGNQFIFYINENDLINKTIEQVLQNMLAEIYVINDYTYKIKQNIGYVKYPDNSLEVEELIKFAEIAMHQAKESKQSIILYQDIILEKINRNNIIKRELHNALEKNELFLVFQPKVNIKNNHIHAEVLIRWKNEKLGFIPPDIFIEIAEKTGEIYKIGKWIFEEAIKEIAYYKDHNINLSINLSPKQLINKHIYHDFTKIIKDYNINPNQVTLELTENAMLDKTENFDLLTKFHQDGIKISIDDFGKGYSSLSYLKDFPISEIKLDKNFVDEIHKPFNAHLVSSISNLSEKLGMSLVIEGVETKEQEEILINLGCYYFQGYYYSKPLNQEDFKKYINKRLDL